MLVEPLAVPVLPNYSGRIAEAQLTCLLDAQGRIDYHAPFGALAWLL